MESLGIGKLIIGEQNRDAIHVPVCPVIAGETLYPGWSIRVQGGVARAEHPGQGIVDPFLSDVVPEKAEFWMFLRPGTITSLRHEWTHPELDQVEPVETFQDGYSRFWIESYAHELGIRSSELLGSAADYLWCGPRLNRGSKLSGVVLDSEFWDHFERLTGTEVPAEKRGNFFS